MSNLNETDVALLRQTVDATNANQVVYATVEQMTNLQALNMVEGNPALVHPDNAAAFAYRARPEGLVYLQNLAAAATPAAAVAAAPAVAPVAAAPAHANAVSGGFAINTGFVPPARVARRPGGNGRTYPFDSMELNQYIFVPATEKRPDPKKSLASTISSANARFKEFVPQRYFRTYRVTAGQKCGDFVAPTNGAVIMRVEPPAPEVQAAEAAGTANA